MKLALSTFALAFAASTTAQFDNASAPFNLVLVSDDSTVNGDTLSACHSGAAIESLCLSNGQSTSKPDPLPPVTFRFNTSDSVITPNATLGQPGILTYDVPANPIIPSGLGFYYDPTTNYALPLFYPGDANTQVLAFDVDSLLNIQGYVDYSTSPPTAGDYVAYYRWYSCATYYAGYQYVNLVWALGDSEPETPDCAKVNVKRVFV